MRLSYHATWGLSTDLRIARVPLLPAVLALLRDAATGLRLRSEDHLRELERMP